MIRHHDARHEALYSSLNLYLGPRYLLRMRGSRWVASPACLLICSTSGLFFCFDKRIYKPSCFMSPLLVPSLSVPQ
ncbi:hypothetical protein L208DRAFT_210873 [Tricholoma matsutake]|nr:hypothetical protein L208DRAFT_210873 [Tricholoma matsutake 945]